ncbi:MAG: DUF433 domain-containing protein [Chthoniobacteraceae bacterium]
MQTPPIELPTSLVWCDPKRLGGQPCFRDTRVPVDAMFGNLEQGMSLDDFLDAFEEVTREQTLGVLKSVWEATPAGVQRVLRLMQSNFEMTYERRC